MTTITKHFVTFFSPGTFVDEVTTKEVTAWDDNVALRMATQITERHDAKPFAFQFTTRTRGHNDLDSHETARGPMHYFGVKVETLAEIEARNDPKENILRSNMRGNGWSRIVMTKSGWRISKPLGDGDIVHLDDGTVLR